MFLILCRNCQTKLKFTSKIGIVQNRYPGYLRPHENLIFLSQGNTFLNGSQQLCLSTSVQVAPLVQNWKKKSGKKTASLTSSSVGIIKDVPPNVQTEFGDYFTYIVNAETVPAEFLPNETTEAQIGHSLEHEVVNVQGLPAMSLHHKKKKNHHRKLMGMTPEALKDLLYASRKFHLQRSLYSYTDVCLRLNQHELAHQTVMYYVTRGKRSSWYPEVDSIEIFNLLLRYAALKGNVEYIKTSVEWLRTLNIALDWQSYLFWLESLSQKKFENKIERTEEVQKVLESMKSQGLSPEDILIKSSPSKAQNEIISKLFETTNSSIRLKQFVFPVGYTCNLLQEFNNVKLTIPESANRGMSLEELKQMMLLQLSWESEEVISIKSVYKDATTDKTRFLKETLKEQEASWRNIITKSLQARLQLLKDTAKKKKTMCIYPYLNLFPIETYVDLLMTEIRLLSESSEYFSWSSKILAKILGIKLMTLHKVAIKQDKGFIESMKSIYHQYLKYTLDSDLKLCFNPREYWQHLLTSNQLENFQASPTPDWPFEVLTDIGKFLYDIVLKDLTIDANILNHRQNKVFVPAFFCVNAATKKKQFKKIQAHRIVTKLYRESQLKDILFEVTSMPMLCPPLPWTNIHSGGFLLAQAKFMRIHETSLHNAVLKDQTPAQQLYPIFDCLNNVSMCPWIVNKPILDLIIEVFNQGGNLKLSLPLSSSSLPLPPSVKSDQTPEEKKMVWKKRAIYRREKSEMHSLWCDALYKLSIANQFRDHVFWFPHNLDFRGRAYATPPHFNHLGSDLVRAILLFANGKPLGPKGLDWLKIHLINLTGLKKKEANSTRLAYANEIMADVLDSADHPFTGRAWWQESEDPWQTLACCMEIAKAIRSGNPEIYICHFPVHQDGTCNGLQHYAALGRDTEGAHQVNLSPAEKPQDVYSGVANLVELERAKDASNGLPMAQILEGHINRKLIKQTVMTVVYGVTRYGARLQILKRLEENTTFLTEHQWAASNYLVQKTFHCIGEMFRNTSVIQYWLNDCAAQISRVRGKTVEWVTPIGLPVIQPYFKSVSGESPDNHNRNCVPNTLKQVNAFPPNFIHSLDSSHMMLTSLYCQRNGIDFVSIHDCYWTHPSSVDAMNKICREQFVALHNEPILEDLSKFLHGKFSVPESEIGKSNSKHDMSLRQLNDKLQQVPKKGSFDLQEVLKSTYFFN